MLEPLTGIAHEMFVSVLQQKQITTYRKSPEQTLELRSQQMLENTILKGLLAMFMAYLCPGAIFALAK